LKDVGYKGCLTTEFVLTIDRTPLAVRSEQAEADMSFTEGDLKFIQVHGSGLIPGVDYDRAVSDSITHLKKFI
jgi:hypothetical protein